MNSILTQKLPQETKLSFPCLMEYRNEKGNTIIIMATSENEKLLYGFVVYSEEGHAKIGAYDEIWDKEKFKLYKGEVRLFN